MKIRDLVANNFATVFEKKLLKEIGDYGVVKNAEAEQIIVEIRRDILFIPLLVEGVIKVMRRDGKGKGLFLYYLTQYQSSAITILYALENKKSEIRLKADCNITYISLPAKTVNLWFEKYESWRQFYLKMNQIQTSFLLEKINDIAFEDLEFRLIKYLEESGLVNNTNVVFKKHFDIARDLRVSREAVSRVLKRLEQKEIITLGRNRITLN